MSLAAPVTPPQVLHVSVFLPSMMKSAWAPYLPCSDSWTQDSMDTSSPDQINEDQMFTSTVETIPSPPRQLDLSTDTQTHVPLTPPHSNPSDSPPYSKSITLPPCTPSSIPASSFITNDLFDQLMSHLIATTRTIQFATGSPDPSDPNLLLTGLYIHQYRYIKSQFETVLQLSQPLPHIQPTIIHINPFHSLHSDSVYFDTYESYLSLFRSQQYKNRKIIQTKKREKQINNARNELRLAIDVLKRRETIVCIDIEAYEFDHKKVTEIGYSIGYFNPQLNRYEVSAHHIIIKEYMNLVNGVRVPNWKFGFLFGESKILSLSNAALEMRRVLKDVNVVVGHGVANDLVWLKKMGVKIDGKKICDVQVLFKAVKGNIECVKLEKVLEYCGIESDRLHNGGNDARFTLEAYLKLVSLEGRMMT